MLDDGWFNRMLRHTCKQVPHVATEAPDTAITMEELHIAVKQGKKLKALGYYGICHDFFQLAWETTKDDLLDVMNHMFIEGSILDSQNMALFYACRQHTSLSILKSTGHLP